MKTLNLIPLLLWLLILGSSSIADAQSLPPEGGIASPQPLSTNYQISLSATLDGKALGKLTLLTCSPDVWVSGPLSSTTTPTSLALLGTLTEEDAGLVFRYTIRFTVPVTTSSLTSKDGSVSSTIEYPEHESKGMLRMNVGTPYDVLNAAGVSYTITMTRAATDEAPIETKANQAEHAER